MNLNDEQKQAVAGWLNQGMKLAEVQRRLESAFGLRLTYMEVKLLVGDLAVLPKDPVAPPPEKPGAGPSGGLAGAPAKAEAAKRKPSPLTEEPPPTARGVQVTVDQLARPGALVSGGVTFSDGQTAVWYMDQAGRLGVAPKQQGYKPAAGDVQEFQMALEQELAKLGLC